MRRHEFIPGWRLFIRDIFFSVFSILHPIHGDINRTRASRDIPTTTPNVKWRRNGWSLTFSQMMSNCIGCATGVHQLSLWNSDSVGNLVGVWH